MVYCWETWDSFDRPIVHRIARTETHPAFKEEAGRAEEERGKKVDKARHMLELVRGNEEAALDMERKAADRTLEVGGWVVWSV